MRPLFPSVFRLPCHGSPFTSNNNAATGVNTPVAFDFRLIFMLICVVGIKERKPDFSGFLKYMSANIYPNYYL